METMGDIVVAIVMVLLTILGFILGRLTKSKKSVTVGNLKVCTGDPDGVYMFLESYVSPEYIMTQKTVTLSVDVTDVSQK